MRTAEGIEQAGPVTRAVTVWYAVFVGPIGAWTVHLLAVASLVRFVCNDPAWRWAMHLATAVTLAATASAMALSWRLARLGESSDEDQAPARLRFLGRVGLAVGAFNAALILLEEIYVVVFQGHSCA